MQAGDQRSTGADHVLPQPIVQLIPALVPVIQRRVTLEIARQQNRLQLAVLPPLAEEDDFQRRDTQPRAGFDILELARHGGLAQWMAQGADQVVALTLEIEHLLLTRSEERRVGKEGG